jgi:glucose/arabinose dehydrogenase
MDRCRQEALVKRILCTTFGGVALISAALLADKIDPNNISTGKNSVADASALKPGQARRITPADLPKPFETKSATNFPRVVPRPEGVMPQAPEGFKVELFVTGLVEPRILRTAPNGDLFLAETRAGEIKIFRGVKDGKPEQVSVFATGLKQPFGIAFYPPGNNPQWVYVGNTDSLVRFPYKNGDLKATGAAQVIVPDLPRKKQADGSLTPNDFHYTRDVAIAKDGKSVFVSVGSGSNVDDPDKVPAERNRASILQYTPEGKFIKVYGSGIRNPVGIGVNPETGELWCSVNERDELGDNLVPDYVTSVKEGGFYGWPYYYIGANPDPRLNGAHPELKDKVIVPDVLIQAHSASLAFSFYTGTQFPREYRGDLFVAEHGSWNRANRSGGEVIRIPLEKGKASGVYQDFLTGFTTADGQMWGRPVSTAVGKDGALYVTDDGSRSIWRVSYTGK